MDNTCILYEKDENGVEVHRVSPNYRGLQDKYGLILLAGNRKQIVGPKKLTPRYYEFYSISHLLEGEGFFWLEGMKEPTTIKAGQVAIITPYTVNCYGCYDADYIESMIIFTGSIADYLRDKGIIASGIWNMGDYPRLNRIIELAMDPAINSQMRAVIEFQKILLDLYEENCLLESKGEYPRVMKLIREIQENKRRWWTVKEMAKYCQMSETYFRKIFHKYTGNSPKAYLEQSKIRQAAEMLCQRNLTIAEIAYYLGYRDPYHFSRRFKQITGISPANYRESFKLHHNLIDIDTE